MSDVYLWETYDRLGRDALEKRDLQQAVEAFRSAVATAEEIGAHDRLVLSLRNLAATMVDLGQLADSYELLNRTLEVAEQSLGPGHSQTVETQRDLAGVCRDLGFLEKAEAYLKAVLDVDRKQGDVDVSPTLLDLAQMAQARDDAATAAEYYERVVELKSRSLGEEHPALAQPLIWLSTAQLKTGQTARATAGIERAFKLLERQFADQPEQMAQSLLAGAQMLVEAGHLEPALPHQKRALDLQTSHFAPDDPKIWQTRELIATTLAGLGQVEEAIELLEYCLRNGQYQGAHLGAIYKNLAGLYLTLGRTDQAEELYGRAGTLLEETLGPDHPAFLATQEERIQLYHFSGRSKEALHLALKTIPATERRFGPGHPNTAQSYASAALLAHNAAEWETSLELMRAAEKIWLSLSPVPEDVLANCRTNLATCLIEMGRREEAETMLELAEESAGPSLRPVIAKLRGQLSSNAGTKGETVEQNDEDEFALPDLGIEEAEDLPPLPSLEESSLLPESPEAAVLDPLDDLDLDLDLPDVAAEVDAALPPLEDDELIFGSDEGDAIDFGGDDALDVEASPPDQVEERAAEVEAREVETEPASPVADREPARPRDPGTGEYLERRAEPRTPLALNRFFSLKVAPAGDGERRELRSFLIDLASGGIRINSETPFPVDEEVVLTLPEDVLGQETDLRARVVWQKPLYGASYLQGLAFGELSPDQRSLLNEKLLPLEGAGRSAGRQHFRLYRPFPIKVRSEGQEEWISSYATDLSVNGLGTRLRQPLEQGNEVRLRLELEFELPTVEVEARVAWSRSGENGISHGLQFASVGPVEAKTIKRYIDRCLEFSPD